MKTEITARRLRLVARFILALALIAFVTLSTARALDKWIFKPPKESQYGLAPVGRPFVPALLVLS